MARKRKNGQGTVRLRSDGRWEGRHVVGYDENGKAKQKSVLAKTKAECVEKLKRLREEYTEVAPFKVKPDMRFGDWMNYWYENHCKPSIRPTTQKGYEEWIYVHAIPGLGHIPLNKLTQADCQKLLNEMKANGRKTHRDTKGPEMAERSVRSCYHVIRMALDRAVKDGLIKKNPILGVKLPPPEPKEMKVLSKEEIQRFLIQAKAEGMYELFLLELTTGLRRGEILALTWDDLNFETGELHISRQVTPVGGKNIISEPKTKAAFRTIILPPVMVGLLREYRKEVFSPLMFPSRIKPNQPIDPSYVRKRLQQILERADCKKVRFHDLRHTFATMSLEHGMDVKTLSAIIGHVSAKTTLNIYTHITNEMQENAAASIDRGIAKAEISRQKAEAASEAQRFEPYTSPRRRPGTGYIKQLKEDLWEGRYSPVWPDGKKHSRNVYGRTQEECEEKLAKLILQMKAEIAVLRNGTAAEYPDGVSPKKKQLAEYLRQQPAPQTIAGLNEHRTLGYLHNGQLQKWQLYDPQQGDVRFSPQTWLIQDDFAAIAAAVQQGMGIAWLPDWLVAQALADGTLQQVLAPSAQVRFAIHAVWPEGPWLPQKTRAAIDALREGLPLTATPG